MGDAASQNPEEIDAYVLRKQIDVKTLNLIRALNH